MIQENGPPSISLWKFFTQAFPSIAQTPLATFGGQPCKSGSGPYDRARKNCIFIKDFACQWNKEALTMDLTYG